MMKNLAKQLCFLLGSYCLISNLNAQEYKENFVFFPEPYENHYNENFGRSVSVKGEYAVVGAYEYYRKGCAYVLHFENDEWVSVARLTAGDGEINDHFGMSVALDENVIVVGAPYDEDNGSSSGSAYVFVMPEGGWTDMTQTAKIKPSDGTERDFYGISVGISGDVVVVGMGNGSITNRMCAVYVYEKPGDGWTDMTQTAKLTDEDGIIKDDFGRSISIFSNTIIVGQRYDSHGGYSRVGSVNVYERPEGGWVDMTQTAWLRASDGENSMYLGSSVFIYENTIVAGAPGDDVGGSVDYGSAYVFVNPAGGWESAVEDAKLLSSNGSSNDNFGHSVGIFDNTIAVGAPFDYNTSDSGSVYIFQKPESGWINSNELAKIQPTIEEGHYSLGTSVYLSENNLFIGVPSDDDEIYGEISGSVRNYIKPAEGWEFAEENYKLMAGQSLNNVSEYVGCGVAIDGDYAVIGSRGYRNKGCAYLFHNNGVSWEQIAVLTASDEQKYAHFGNSVSIEGDVVVVGAVSKDEVEPNAGAVYVFVKPVNGWHDMTETAKLYASDGQNSSDFGYVIDINEGCIIVGSTFYDDITYMSGAAYIYEKPATGWQNMTQTAKLLASENHNYDYLGSSVGISGDYIAVGASYWGPEGDKKGAVFLYKKPDSGWKDTTETGMIRASDGMADDFFGSSLSFNDNYILVGASYADKDGDRSGSAYLYEINNNDLSDISEVAILSPSDGTENNKFGRSVYLTDDAAVIGAMSSDNAGCAYVYHKPAGGWTSMTEDVKMVASDGIDGDDFGCSVGMSGNSIIVGSQGQDDNGPFSGAAYIFGPPSTTIFNNFEEEKNGITVYPIPSGNVLYVNSPKEDIQSIMIYNITGNKLLEYSGNRMMNEINISDLREGIYILEIQSDADLYLFKVIKN